MPGWFKLTICAIWCGVCCCCWWWLCPTEDDVIVCWLLFDLSFMLRWWLTVSWPAIDRSLPTWVMVSEGFAVVAVPRTVFADAAVAFITSGCSVIKLPVMRPVLVRTWGRTISIILQIIKFSHFQIRKWILYLSSTWILLLHLNDSRIRQTSYGCQIRCSDGGASATWQHARRCQHWNIVRAANADVAIWHSNTQPSSWQTCTANLNTQRTHLTLRWNWIGDG